MRRDYKELEEENFTSIDIIGRLGQKSVEKKNNSSLHNIYYRK